MAETERLRTFLAIYRSGSLTDAAYHRGISQPAASQHLAALERTVGAPLFVRVPTGVTPTQRAHELYGQVAEPLDALEAALAELHGDASRAPGPAVRFGSSPEYFGAEVLPRIAGTDIAVTALFGDDDELLELVDRGEIDVAVTSTTPRRRSLNSVAVGSRQFTLVAAPTAAPDPPLRTVRHLAAWLPDQPWVSYSLELPVTRRFWQTVLDRPFTARPRLVAPDLRAVLRAVELGIGVSLLPTFVCAESLAAGSVVEPFPVSGRIEASPWFACTRAGEARRPALRVLLTSLGAPLPQPASAATPSRPGGSGRAARSGGSGRAARRIAP